MEQKRNVVRLAEPVKSGLQRILFSRIPVIVFLLILQVMIYGSIYSWLSKYFPYFAVIQYIFSAVMIIFLFNNRMDSSAKLTWMWIISLAPIAGTLFLAFTQSNWGNRKNKERVKAIIRSTQNELQQKSEVLETLASKISESKRLFPGVCRDTGGLLPPGRR